MNLTPKYSEFRGVYNVDLRFVDGAEEEEVLCTESGLEPPTYAEIDDLSDKLEELNDSFGRGNRSLSYSLGFSDRTALVTIVRFEILDVAILERLQMLLRNGAKRWRIVVPGVDEESTIVIYPTRIAYPASGSPSEVVLGIKQQLAEECEQTDGVFQRQLEYVKLKLVTETIKQIGTKGQFEPIIVAVFDSVHGDNSCLCVWLLQDGYAHENRCWIPDDELGDGFRGMCGGSELDVTNNGSLVPFMDAGQIFLGRICALAYRKTEFEGKVTLVSPHDKKIVHHKIKKTQVMSDIETRRLLSNAQSGYEGFNGIEKPDRGNRN